MIWIIDASVAIRWFIDEEVHAHADEVLEKESCRSFKEAYYVSLLQRLLPSRQTDLLH